LPTQGPNERQLVVALKDAQVPNRDQAAVQLARRLAQLLDAARGTDEEAAVYSDLGPKYLAALTALGLTLAGRNVKGGITSGPPASRTKLDQLRDKRERRAAGAAG
jgi:hypothetical protein